MGKKKKGSSKPSKAHKGPKAPPSSKAGGKKRTSDKKGGAIAAVSDVLSSMDMSQLPSLPGFSAAPPKVSINPSTGQMQFKPHRKRSRKGLSGSDIKGFLRVNKFAGMMTKVTGKKHTASAPRRRKSYSF